jgi:Tfp pilus assembly protein PilX
MQPIPSHPRGTALVMAMIVVVLITLLVAGAISFTGTERGASQIQSQEDQMSACVQATRNLFLSRMRLLPASSVELVSFDETLNGEALVATRHFSGAPTNPGIATLKAVTDATATVQDPNVNVESIDQRPGNPQNTKFYAITAVCKESADPGSPEREVEFLVRVGL